MTADLLLIIFIPWAILVTHLGVWNECLSKKIIHKNSQLLIFIKIVKK